tara:strand:+ start:233 stop:766 length:534 start_codon:yes stop_codon:yes gene_type:complete
MVFNTNILAGSSGQGEDALTITKARSKHLNNGSSFCQIWTFDGVSSPDTLLQTSTTITANTTIVEYTFSTDPVVTGQNKIWIVLRGAGDVNVARHSSPGEQMIGGGYYSLDGDATNIRVGFLNNTARNDLNPAANFDLSDGRTSVGMTTNSTTAIGVGSSGSGTDTFPIIGGLVSIA